MTLTPFACKMRPRMFTRPSIALLALVSTLTLGACEGLPPPGILIVYTTESPELAMASIDPESGSWESAPWRRSADSRWLPYPARGQLQLQHNLDRRPQNIIVYLAFEQTGLRPAQASGNLARIVDADETTLTVWNDTNGNYFARVVAQ